MLWPVTDGLRISRVAGFTNTREGYKLNWNAWYRELNTEDQRQLPLQAFNRTRLYFDLRLIPIAAADLHPLSRDLENEDPGLYPSYLERFRNSHFCSILLENWSSANYSPMRERESQRAQDAREWFETVTDKPVLLGRRIAKVLRELGIDATHEGRVRTRHANVRADILVDRPNETPRYALVELKAFSAENTMPSTIRDAVRGTLRKYAQLGGFLPRQ